MYQLVKNLKCLETRTKRFNRFELNNQRESVQKTLQYNFFPLSIYLWLHFVGFDDGLKCKRKYILKNIISISLAFTNQIISFCYLYQRFRRNHILNIQFGKSDLVILVAFILDLLLRILLYIKKSKLCAVHKELAKIYDVLNEGKILNLRSKFLLMFTINDLCNIGLELFQQCFLLNYSVSAFNFLNIILANWAFTTISMPAMFLCYCLILNEIFISMKKQLLHKRSTNIQHLYKMYDNVIDLAISVNEILHSILFITFSVLLGLAFFNTYRVIYITQTTNMTILYHCSCAIVDFFRIALMCWYSSSVTKSAVETKGLIFKFPCNITPIVFNIQDKFVGFTLLDSIVIGKSLIITLTGSFFTYGMLIASFQGNTIDKMS